MVKRIAVVDNTKLKDMDKKKYIASLCPINRKGDDCMYFDGNKLLIDESLCIGCGICVNDCTMDVIRMDEEQSKVVIKYPEDCICCACRGNFPRRQQAR